MPDGDDEIERRAARRGAGTAMTAMRMPSRRAIFFRSWMSWIGTPPRDCWPTFSLQVVEERGDLEAFLPEARIVGEREPEVAGAHDGDAQLPIEPENLPQVALQIADVVADAADAELAEVREVLADLRGVQVELLGERLRRDRAHARAFELVEAAQVDRQPIGRELGDLVEALLAWSWTRPCSQFSQAIGDCSKNISAWPGVACTRTAERPLTSSRATLRSLVSR